jgi:Ca2+-transporting ATPase
MQLAEGMAEKGLRVIALACRRFSAVPDPLTPETVEVGRDLSRLVGLLDPPRPEAAEAVATCRAAGVTVVMITGDHPVTARNIAARPLDPRKRERGADRFTAREARTGSPY